MDVFDSQGKLFLSFTVSSDSFNSKNSREKLRPPHGKGHEITRRSLALFFRIIRGFASSQIMLVESLGTAIICELILQKQRAAKCGISAKTHFTHRLEGRHFGNYFLLGVFDNPFKHSFHVVQTARPVVCSRFCIRMSSRMKAEETKGEPTNH